MAALRFAVHAGVSETSAVSLLFVPPEVIFCMNPPPPLSVSFLYMLSCVCVPYEGSITASRGHAVRLMHAGMYTMWLCFPAIIGVALFIHQLADNTIGVQWIAIYGILIALWITAFLEFWKREQTFRAMEWGTSGTSVCLHMCVMHHSFDCACSCVLSTSHVLL